TCWLRVRRPSKAVQKPTQTTSAACAARFERGMTVADAAPSPPDPESATEERYNRRVRPEPGILDHLGALRTMPRGLLLGRIAYRLKRPLLALPSSVKLLPGSHAAHPRTLPPDRWPGDAAQGAAMVQSRFRFAGGPLVNPDPLRGD